MIKSIPTIYNGIKFRSRLEARWAVFYDCLRVEYFYEYEGFQLTGETGMHGQKDFPPSYYLPDFYLPDIRGGCYVEIKGQKPTPYEDNKCMELSLSTNKDVFIFFGDIKYDECPNESAYWYGRGYDINYQWCQCYDCNRYGIEFEGRSARICKCDLKSDKNYTADSPDILEAYKTAQKYSFWNPNSSSRKHLNPIKKEMI